MLGCGAVFAGYKNILPKLIGFTYKAFGVMWRENGCWLMVEPADIARKVNRFLSRHSEQSKGATVLLKDGDLVEVDADKGVVKIIK